MSNIFTGSSRYSSDFQAVIDRSVAIASLPLTQMQKVSQELTDDATAFRSLDAKFARLQAALIDLEAATGSPSYKASVSGKANVSPSLSTGALLGTYKIDVISAGAYATVTSKDPSLGPVRVKDPSKESISASTDFTLTINGSPLASTITAGNLNTLVSEINRLAGDDVQASLVNIGHPDGEANYVLSLQGRNLADDRFQLTSNSVDYLPADPLNYTIRGGSVQYKVNGAPTASSSSRTLSISSGVTVGVLPEVDTGTTTLRIERDPASVQQALNGFAAAYNAVVDELGKHRGEDPGALEGHSMLYTLDDTLRKMSGYDGGTGTLGSLAVLGLEPDKEGKLSLNTELFREATEQGLGDVLDLLGTSKTGGFLKSATALVDMVEKEGTGLLKATVTQATEAVRRQDAAIAAEKGRLELLTAGLQHRMAEADALIAVLEQQVSYFSGMFESMRVASESMR
jgi:flagellar capping protein FliD